MDKGFTKMGRTSRKATVSSSAFWLLQSMTLDHAHALAFTYNWGEPEWTPHKMYNCGQNILFGGAWASPTLAGKLLRLLYIYYYINTLCHKQFESGVWATKGVAAQSGNQWLVLPSWQLSSPRPYRLPILINLLVMGNHTVPTRDSSYVRLAGVLSI